MANDSTYLLSDKPECNIKQIEDDGYILLSCESRANPEDVTFGWRKENETIAEEDFEQEGLISELRLEPSPESFGTYFCYVNNSVGPGEPCEIDVQGEMMDRQAEKKIDTSGGMLTYK